MKEIISSFLPSIGVPVSKRYCEKLITSHAEFPSLLSVVDTLDRLGIPHVVGKVEKEKIGELEFPYLLQVETTKTNLIEIRSAKDLESTFMKYWSGIVLKLEPTQSIKDPESNRAYVKEKFRKTLQWVLSITSGAIFLWSFANSSSPGLWALLATALPGVGIGYLLVAKELGIRFEAVETFCTTGKKSDCDAVLSSDGAKLFGTVKLSDAVLAFFVFQVVYLSIAAVWSNALSAILLSLGVVSVVSLAAVGYSLYYQKFVLNAWCRLCLLVDVVLVTQVAIFGYLGTITDLQSVVITLPAIAVGIIVFVMIACAVLLVKAEIESRNEVFYEGSRGTTVKNSPDVFLHLLSRQELAAPDPTGEEMVIGNPDAPLSITMVGNLHCNPCGLQHKKLEEMFEILPDKFKVNLRLFKSRSEEGNAITSNQYVIQYWYRFLRDQVDEQRRTLKLLHDWYEDMDLEKFQKKYPMTPIEDFEPAIAIENQNYDWIEKSRIIKTPTFLIAGRALPKSYYVADLPPLIPGLIHNLVSSPSESHSKPVMA
jgi:uncharacterized membrane protein